MEEVAAEFCANFGPDASVAAAERITN